VLNQKKLLQTIEDYLRGRRAAIHVGGVDGQDEKYLEWGALVGYRQNTQDAGTDQLKLEAVVASLEKHPDLGDYQRWRERATV
jgi:hypothetical protein